VRGVPSEGAGTGPWREGAGIGPSAGKLGTGPFAEAARAAVRLLPQEHVEALASRLASGASPAGVLDAVALSAYRDVAARVVSAIEATGTDRVAGAAHLRALAEGYVLGRSAQQVEVVWSGPTSSVVPVRATARVLADLAAEAKRNLILMTYSARPYPPLAEALTAAMAGGVTVAAVVETLGGAGGALSGEEPAAAFLAIPGVQIWHWLPDRRPERSSKMHAKLAVADETVLLVSSANLTQAGIGKNIEAGLLVRGGQAPVRAAEHIRHLPASGALARLY
jgi:phosphatidylserine/phosphatidylglycerophosphate/cardiolipin synthase-like enzyme